MIEKKAISLLQGSCFFAFTTFTRSEAICSKTFRGEPFGEVQCTPKISLS